MKSITAPSPRQILEALWPSCQIAAAYAREIQGRIRAQPEKAGTDNLFAAALTDADLSIQTLIEVALLATFPTLRFYGEEDARSYNAPYFRSRTLGPAGDYLILLDPIDGTRFYLDGHPNYHMILSIADAEDYAAVLVINPRQGTYYCALRGAGAYQGDLTQPLAAAVPFRLAPAPPRVYLSGTLPHLTEALRAQFRVVYLPTDYSPIVPVPNHTGILDGSLTGSVLEDAAWIDAAAVAFLAHEAGCVVTTLRGEPLPSLQTCPAHHRSGMVIGTTPDIHQRLLTMIAAHLPS